VRLSSLFSKEQRNLFAMHAPDGIELDDLSVLGPVLVLKLKYTPEGGCAPADRRALELSRWQPDHRAVDEVRALGGLPGRRRYPRVLMERGIPPDGKQETKTRTALEFPPAR
jgi:hypothetical protein